MYSSPTDVRLALTPGGAEDDATTAAILEDDQITDAIKEADGIIDTYLSATYDIPQDPTAIPADSVAVYPVRAWSRDIAAYLATLTYRKSKDIEDEDPVIRRWRWIVGILEKISEGKLKPNLPPSTGDSEPQGAVVYNQYIGKLFTMEDVFVPPGRRHGVYPDWYARNFRYGDLLLVGSGYNEVLILFEGQAIPVGTPNDTLVVFIPEGS